MQEIELKFQVPAAARRAVASAVGGPDKPNRVRLQAAYFDTASRDLAQDGLALRVRREGRRWVQTLKGATGSDGLTRAEHNVPLVAAGLDTPPADPALHAGTPVGERLRALLAAGGAAHGDGLVCRYRTDIRRRARRIDVDGRGVAGDADDGFMTAAAPAAADPAAAAADDPAVAAAAGRVELAFDEGAIVAGERRLVVCELEIEGVDGSPLAVIATASHWAARYGLWLDTRSKAERGDLLARDETTAPPRRAQPLALTAAMGVGPGRRAVLLNCLDQIAINASQVASGEFRPEHVHQLRVGLRRLRSALRLFAPAATASANADEQVLARLDEQAAVLFRQLGATRDADAIARPMARALADAMRSVGVDDGAMPAPPAAAAPDPTACVRDAASQQLLLGLLRVGQATRGDAVPASRAQPADAPRALRRLLSQRLQRWHRQVRRDADRFAALDDAQRHRLRKRAKRLRYAVEFASALYPQKSATAYLRALRRLQDRLGLLNDVAVAVEAYRGQAGQEPRALFALGWLASRRAAVLDACASDVDAFIDTKRFWRRKKG